MLTSHRLLTFVVLTAPVLPIFAWSQSAPHAEPATSTAHVTIENSVELDGGAKGLYRVSYSYDFPQRSSVYIRGVGTVPAKGSLSYIHAGREIEFLDGPLGSPLHVAKIENPVTLMGSSPELPAADDFPPEVRHGLWRQSASFSKHAIGVLEQFFRSGLCSYEKDQDILYVTTYSQIATQLDNTQIKIKIKISHPKNDSGEVPFTLAFKAQERKSHTDWRETLGDASLPYVQSFVDQVLAQLQR